jgi:glycosyltransferase involved in cell wall biosynthesis
MAMTPSVSVVMAVRNGGARLTQTITSIRAQTHRDLEFIIVDDGSTDATPSVLKAAAEADARIRIIPQPGSGLTRALLRGCSEARGEFIARQDSGDSSHPDRIAAAIDNLRANPETVLWASEVASIGPDDEPLFVTRLASRAIRESLLSDDIDHITSIPHHGAAVFRRDAYVTAGGYRPQFWFAQDLDLWVRMARIGKVALDPRELYISRVDETSISSLHRAQQIATARLIVAIRDSRDPAVATRLLAQAEGIRPEKRPPTRAERAAASYYIGSALVRNRDPRARRYLLRTLRLWPLHARAWIQLVRAG